MAKRKSSPNQNTAAADVKPQVIALAGVEPAAEGLASRLGPGLWGIVGNKTRYSSVSQFSGIEYVRYEYRRIPEQFRAAALASTYLDVIEITGEAAPVVAEVDTGEGHAEVAAAAELKVEEADVPADEFPEG